MLNVVEYNQEMVFRDVIANSMIYTPLGMIVFLLMGKFIAKTLYKNTKYQVDSRQLRAVF